eukprot:437024-Pleurochrysis_carterae.AAC.2
MARTAAQYDSPICPSTLPAAHVQRSPEPASNPATPRLPATGCPHSQGGRLCGLVRPLLCPLGCDGRHCRLAPPSSRHRVQRHCSGRGAEAALECGPQIPQYRDSATPEKIEDFLFHGRIPASREFSYIF